VLWYVIDYDLVCISFSNNSEINMCEIDGLGVSYILVIVVVVLLFKYMCNTDQIVVAWVIWILNYTIIGLGVYWVYVAGLR